MTERIREIRFSSFRGLPDYRCELNGKSIAILGGTGKGKSAIVDGIEYLFTGSLRRFHGRGSGNIDADAAMHHVLKEDQPSVEFRFTPTNESVKRILGGGALKASRPSVQNYIDEHPPAEAFVLRRSQLLEFIYGQDAERYQKYIRLLGLDDIDKAQKSFVEAEKEIDDKFSQCQNRLGNLLQMFVEPGMDWRPTNLSDIRAKGSAVAQPFGVKTLTEWNQLDDVISALDAMRSKETKQRINALNLAIDHLRVEVPSEIESIASALNQLSEQLDKMQAESEEVARGSIIEEGLKYFQEHPDIIECPLCEQKLEEGYQAIFERLDERNSALGKLRELETAWSQKLDALITALQRLADQLSTEQAQDYSLYPDGYAQVLVQHHETLQEWLKRVKSIRERRSPEAVTVPPNIGAVRSVRLTIYGSLVKERDTLIQPDAIALEKAIGFLQRAKEKEPEIRVAESAKEDALKLSYAIRDAREAFSRARESAVQAVFDKIAEKVLSYYHRLHDFGAADESSECTDLSLTSTSRAAAGGLQLAIEFLGKVKSCDPRAFLSEGHLDSLGLCLYLATVRKFNDPGSLLVLDDVLTSIDKEHRHRVAELLLEDFSDFQLVVTTHDEYWFDLLQSKALARGEQDKWRFKRIARWTLEKGPESAAYEGTWNWIESNLIEEAYRELGGSLRLVFEDFLKRVADKMELKVKYHIDGKYTAGDFKFAGIHERLREQLTEKTPDEEQAIKQDISRVFGLGDLVTFFSHDNPGRLEVTLMETKDFVNGLKSLERRCKTHKLVKGINL
jgi:DNA repair exonuclease SbcCD ATPase subunit